ncbi:hypothetical protein KIW84_035241 [Lathyrus oleraceus]|uniref:Uncharacterized protein n=1 Tax=Pisum sativum TaxID=3888 RepID=A0A9D5B5Q3_PEA|nr:hypothetical protein KIW84_035241 [Pisum sativum]
MKLKGIDGGPHKRWSMWFNSMQSEEPYQGLTCTNPLEREECLRECDTGGAWLSSACATVGDKPEEGEDDVKSSCPLCPGLHKCYNGPEKGSRPREGELTSKTCPQFGL